VDDGHVLRNRRFLALWSGNTLSLVGTAGVRIAYPLLALTLFHSAALAGWIAFAATFPALLLQVPAGIVADSVNRRTLMLLAQVVGLTATLSVVLAIGWHLPAVLVASAVAEGAAFVFFSVAEVGAVRDVVDDRHRTAAFSFLEAEQPVANLAGRAVGGVLFALTRSAPFLLNAFSYLFCLLTLSTMPKRLFEPAAVSPEGVVSSTGRFWRRMGHGLSWTWRIPYLRLTTIVTGFTNILFQCTILLILVVAAREGRPVWTAGVILAAAGAGGILGSLTAPRLDRSASPRALFLGCVWAWTALLLLVALSKNTVVLLLAWGGVGAVGAVCAIVLTMARVRAVPDAELGQMVGAATVITDGAVPIGAVAGGYLLSSAGPSIAAWVVFGAMLVAAVSTTRLLKPVTGTVMSTASPNSGSPPRTST
jgi:predicted MFS family arabinose efflux permease